MEKPKCTGSPITDPATQDFCDDTSCPRHYPDRSPMVDEPFLKSIGWKQIGNTWYPPESSHRRQYDSPLMFWCRVDGALRVCSNKWASDNDVTQAKFLEVCSALDVEITGVQAKT